MKHLLFLLAACALLLKADLVEQGAPTSFSGSIPKVVKHPPGGGA